LSFLAGKAPLGLVFYVISKPTLMWSYNTLVAEV